MALPYRAVTPFFAHTVPAAVFVTSLWFFGPANSPLDRYDHSLDNHDDSPYGLGPNVPDHPLTEGAEHLSAAPVIFDVPTSTETETQYITVTTTQVALPDDYVPMRSGIRNFRSRHADLILANPVDSPVSWFKNNAVFRFFNAALFIPMFDIFRYFIEVAILMPHYFLGAVIAVHTMAAFVIFMAMCLYNWWQRRRSRQQPSPQSPPTSPPPPGGNGPPPPGGGGPPPDDSPPGGSPPSNAPAPPATPGPKPRDDNRANFSGPTVETSPRSPALDAGRLTADLTNAVEAQRVQTLETNLRVCNETSQIKTQTIRDRDATIERLEAENKLIHERRNSTSSDISDLRIKLRTAQTALAESDEQLRQERENAKKAADRASDITSRNMSQRTAHDTLRKRCTSLEGDLQRVRHDRDSATTERDNLKAALTQQEADAEKARVDAVDRAYTTANREHNDLKRRHTVLEEELQESRRQLAELRAAAPPPTAPAPQSDGADVAALRQEIEKLNASLAEEQKKVASANADGMSERLAAFGSPRSKDKYDQTLKEASDSRSEVASLTSEKQRLVQQNERLLKEQKHGDEVAERRQKAAEAELQRSKDAEQRATTSLERSQAQVDTLSRAKSDAETAIKEQQYAAAQAQKAQQEAEQRLSNIDENYRDEIKRLNQQLTALSQTQNGSSDALQQQQQASAAAEQERLQNVAHEAERKAAQHEEEKKQAENEVKRLQNSLGEVAAQLDAEKESNHKKTDNLNTTVENLVNQNSHLQTAHDNYKALSERHAANGTTLEVTHNKLQAEHEALQRRNNELQSNLDRGQAEYNKLQADGNKMLSDLQSQVNGLMQWKAKTLEDIQEAQSEYDGAKKEASEAIVKQDKLEELLTAERAASEAQANTARRNEASQRSVNQDTWDQLQAARDQLERRGAPTAVYKQPATNAELQKDHDALDKKNEDQRRCINRLKGEQDKLAKQIDEARSDTKDLKEKLAKVEESNIELTEQNLRFHARHGPLTDDSGSDHDMGDTPPVPSNPPAIDPTTQSSISTLGTSGPTFPPPTEEPASAPGTPGRQIRTPRSPRRSPQRGSISPLRRVMNPGGSSASSGLAAGLPDLGSTTAPMFGFGGPSGLSSPFTSPTFPSRDEARNQANLDAAAQRELDAKREAEAAEKLHQERHAQAALEFSQLQGGTTNDALSSFNIGRERQRKRQEQNRNDRNGEQDTEMDTGEDAPQVRGLPDMQSGGVLVDPAVGVAVDPLLTGGVPEVHYFTEEELRKREEQQREEEKRQREEEERLRQADLPQPRFVVGSEEEIAHLRTLPHNENGRQDQSYRYHDYEEPDDWEDEDSANPMPMYFRDVSRTGRPYGPPDATWR
ncbi:hypothetical protein D6C81_05863 [Aureobasidium pullulans]|nr:hypothetical protein D6C81_05863 [Aureobasidium pullulans]